MTAELLRLKYRVAYEVDCRDLDKFVAPFLEQRGLTWRALDTGYDGYHNGSYFSYTVEIGADIEDDLDQDFDRWLMGEGPFYDPGDDVYAYDMPGIQHILQWLGNMAVIPEGNYVVHLWW